MSDNLDKVFDLLTNRQGQGPQPAFEGGPNIEFAWNNYYGSWTDGGWNNYYGSWTDGGWNNYYGSWSDGGWNNYYGSWSDGGWNNYYGSWGDGSPGGGGGGCFLTSACVSYKNLPDDCYELQVLRAIRDTIVTWDDEHREMVQDYYSTAPKIVEAINASGHSADVWENLYNNLVLPCVKFYEEQKIDDAVTLYRETVNSLKEQYLSV